MKYPFLYAGIGLLAVATLLPQYVNVLSINVAGYDLFTSLGSQLLTIIATGLIIKAIFGKG